MAPALPPARPAVVFGPLTTLANGFPFIPWSSDLSCPSPKVFREMRGITDQAGRGRLPTEKLPSPATLLVPGATSTPLPMRVPLPPGGMLHRTHLCVHVDPAKVCCYWYQQKWGPPSSERSWEPLEVLGRQGAGAASALASAGAGTRGGGAGTPGGEAGTPGGGVGRGSGRPRSSHISSI